MRMHSKWLVVTLSLLLVYCSVAAGTLPVVHKQDFDGTDVGGLPSDWTLLNFHKSPDEPQVIEAPAELTRDGRVLYIGRTSGSPNITGHANYSFEPVNERLQLVFDMWNTTTIRNLRVCLGGTAGTAGQIHNALAKTAIFLSMTGGQVVALKDAKANEWTEVGQYTPGRWHTIMLDIDIKAQVFNVYLDGSTTPENAAPISFYTENHDLNTIAFAYQHAANTDPVYIDNVIIRGK
ncbi:MAG: hypothetical protein PHH90_08960 [Limnochordia bacterium]|nr:hypothetical protein [Limnochordia bacterium]